MNDVRISLIGVDSDKMELVLDKLTTDGYRWNVGTSEPEQEPHDGIGDVVIMQMLGMIDEYDFHVRLDNRKLMVLGREWDTTKPFDKTLSADEYLNQQ